MAHGFDSQGEWVFPRSAPRCRRKPRSAAVALAHIVFLSLSCLPRYTEARDLFSQLAHFKPPPQVKALGQAIGQAAEAQSHKTGAVSEVAKTLEHAVEKDTIAGKVAKVVTVGSPKVASAIQHVDVGEIMKVEGALTQATPEISHVLEHADPNRVVAALKSADPKKLREALNAIGSLTWFRARWPVLLALVFAPTMLGWFIWCKLGRWIKRLRGKHSTISMESEMRLLHVEGEGPLFARAALHC